MARGWGRSEEDLGAEKEQAREDRRSSGGRRTDAEREALARGLRLSLVRIEDQLAKSPSEARRRALETARTELLERLARFEGEASPR
jgi:hypothetical protein